MVLTRMYRINRFILIVLPTVLRVYNILLVIYYQNQITYSIPGTVLFLLSDVLLLRYILA